MPVPRARHQRLGSVGVELGLPMPQHPDHVRDRELGFHRVVVPDGRLDLVELPLKDIAICIVDSNHTVPVPTGQPDLIDLKLKGSDGTRGIAVRRSLLEQFVRGLTQDDHFE